jgi:hypothetical protein
MKRSMRLSSLESEAKSKLRVEREKEYQLIKKIGLNTLPRSKVSRQLSGYRANKPKPVTLAPVSFLKSDAHS